MVFVFDLSANNLEITNLSTTGNQLNFDVTWDNSWRSGLTYHDAVWIFVKQLPNGGPTWQHATLNTATVDPGYQTLITSDGVGFFIRRSSNGIGTATTMVELTIDNAMGVYQDFKVLGTEMVYVPQGDFYAGDGASTSRIHVGNDNSLPVHITSDGALDCGSSATEIGLTTGTCYDIPAEYPAGYNAFYSMKYVVTQQQYVDFLNCLPRHQQEERVNSFIGGTTVTNTFVMANKTFPQSKSGVRCDANIGTGVIEFYVDGNDNDQAGDSDDGVGRANGFFDTEHWLAYLDWSGLRPYSFLEFEKASRGPAYPVANELCWGTPNFTLSGATINLGTDSEKHSNSGTDLGINHGSLVRVGCNAPSTNASRELSGASFYGIIDLGNHLSDLYIGPDENNPYTGTHGDGILDVDGNANNADWLHEINHGTKSLTGISQLFEVVTLASKPSVSGRGVRSL